MATSACFNKEHSDALIGIVCTEVQYMYLPVTLSCITHLEIQSLNFQNSYSHDISKKTTVKDIMILIAEGWSQMADFTMQTFSVFTCDRNDFMRKRSQEV